MRKVWLNPPPLWIHTHTHTHAHAHTTLCFTKNNYNNINICLNISRNKKKKRTYCRGQQIHSRPLGKKTNNNLQTPQKSDTVRRERRQSASVKRNICTHGPLACARVHILHTGWAVCVHGGGVGWGWGRREAKVSPRRNAGLDSCQMPQFRVKAGLFGQRTHRERRRRRRRRARQNANLVD